MNPGHSALKYVTPGQRRFLRNGQFTLFLCWWSVAAPPIQSGMVLFQHGDDASAEPLYLSGFTCLVDEPYETPLIVPEAEQLKFSL
jgi:hypothetical protein